VCAPSKTPPEIIARLTREIDALLADAKVEARLAELGGKVSAGTPADFGKFIAAETEKRGKVVRAAGVRAD